MGKNVIETLMQMFEHYTLPIFKSSKTIDDR